VLLHDERNLRGFWKLARIEELLKGPDRHVRGAVIRVSSRSSSTILRRPLSQLYPLEIECRLTVDLNQPPIPPKITKWKWSHNKFKVLNLEIGQRGQQHNEPVNG